MWNPSPCERGRTHQMAGLLPWTWSQEAVWYSEAIQTYKAPPQSSKTWRKTQGSGKTWSTVVRLLPSHLTRAVSALTEVIWKVWQDGSKIFQYPVYKPHHTCEVAISFHRECQVGIKLVTITVYPSAIFVRQGRMIFALDG